MATAQRRAEEALAIGRACGDAEIEIMALAMQRLALVGAGAVEPGMARLDEGRCIGPRR